MLAFGIGSFAAPSLLSGRAAMTTSTRVPRSNADRRSLLYHNDNNHTLVYSKKRKLHRNILAMSTKPSASSNSPDSNDHHHSEHTNNYTSNSNNANDTDNINDFNQMSLQEQRQMLQKLISLDAPTSASSATSIPIPEEHPPKPIRLITRTPALMRKPVQDSRNQGEAETSSSDDDFKRRNLFGLRAIADGAATTLLYDFLTSFADGCVTFSIDILGSNRFDFHWTGVELIVGAGVGVWTVVASTNKQTKRKKEEEKQREARVGREVASIAKEWNAFLNSLDHMLDAANILSVGRMTKKHELATEDDVDTALLWLETMEEFEGDMAYNMFRKLESSPILAVRVRLARGLGSVQTPSNIVFGTLSRLEQDHDVRVRNVASASLGKLRASIYRGAEPILAGAGPTGTSATLSVWDFEAAGLSSSSAAAFAAASSSLVYTMSEMKMGGEQAAFAAMRGDRGEPSPVERFDVLDVHTLCIVSAMALGAEMFCVYHGHKIPFRFVGLGWIFAVAGLAVYPRSHEVWMRVLKDIKNMKSHRESRNSK